MESVEIFVDAMSEQTTAASEIRRISVSMRRLRFTIELSFARRGRSCATTGLAEDVTQEVFLRLYNHLDAIENEEMLRPWLIRVALNMARNTLRGKIRANTRDENYVKETVETEVCSAEIDLEQREHGFRKCSEL